MILIIFWCLRPVCVRLRTQIPDLCKAVWPAIVNLRTYERLDVQEDVQSDHKATYSAVFIVLYALTFLYYAHDFECLRSILLEEIVKSTLQLYAQRLYE